MNNSVTVRAEQRQVFKPRARIRQKRMNRTHVVRFNKAAPPLPIRERKIELIRLACEALMHFQGKPLFFGDDFWTPLAAYNKSSAIISSSRDQGGFQEVITSSS